MSLNVTKSKQTKAKLTKAMIADLEPASKDYFLWDTQIEQDYQNLPPESVMILEYVNKHGRITTKQADQLLKAPRPTVKLRLKQLVAQDHLTLHGKGRGSYYEKA